MNLLSHVAEQTGISEEIERVVRKTTRRKLLFGGSLLASLWGAKQARAGSPPGSIHWLVQRLTMGVTQEELNLANSLGANDTERYDNYLEYHLNYPLIDDSVLDARLVNYPTLNMLAWETIDLPEGTVINQLIEALILRSVLSKRQLFERMAEFWTDHFNIDITAVLEPGVKTVDDRDVVRANALGTFPNILSASAHSAAMMIYLDNASSVVGNPNENDARELMELHTMGVDGGYTQQDVQEVARCFTGWGIYRGSTPELRYSFAYTANRHDNGQKTVLGQVIPAGGGMNDGVQVLNILVNHPSTAAFISRKLCERFWGESPPPSLVTNVAATYTSTGGNIADMLRTLFHDPEVGNAPSKYKRPYHQYMSALRGSGATITNSSGIRSNLTAAGQLPFYWSPPDGYPDGLDKWVGLILPRWNFGASMATNAVGGTSLDINVFLLGAPNTPQGVMDRIDATLFGGLMPAADKARIQAYMSGTPTTTQKREALGLAIGSPGFQWY